MPHLPPLAPLLLRSAGVRNPPPRRQDHYADLGVPADAAPRAIEQAFERWRALRRGGQADDATFHRAERAYHVLADPARRARHDRQTGRTRHPAWLGPARAAGRLSFRRGLRQLNRGRPAPALAHLDRAARLSPGDPACRSWLALLLARSGARLHEAAGLAAAAVASEPREPAFLFNLAAVYAAAGVTFRAVRLRAAAWALLLVQALSASRRPRRGPAAARKM